MMRFSRSLTFRLLCLSIAASTLPALVVTWVQRSISTRVLEQSIQQQQTELARRIAEEVNGEIRSAQSLLNFVARSLAARASGKLESEALQNLLRAVPDFQEVMLVSASGEERLKATRRGFEKRLIHRSENLQDPSIGAPFFSVRRLPTILISEPIRSDRTRLSGLPAGQAGALVAKMSFAALGGLMQETRIGSRGQAFIVDAHGNLLAHPDQARVRAHAFFGRLPVVRDWIGQPSAPTGLREYTDEGGTPVIALAFPIPLLKSAVVVQQPRADVYAPLVHMRNQFILWTLFWVCVFAGGMVSVAWHILEPLRQLQAAAEQIGQGRMDIRLSLHSYREFEELGSAFQKMADSLRHMEEIRRDFISMIVHDLKIPLTNILASLDFLLGGEIGDLNEDQHKFVSLGRRSGQDLLMLIQNLLDVAKMEEGKLTLQKGTLLPRPWAESVIASFRPLAEPNKKRLHLAASEDLPPVEADTTLLSRVLGNLISNALRHTPYGFGEVTVSLLRQEDHLAVEVRDNGEGIPPEDQEYIFEKFAQARKKHTKIRSGTGLGLTFCKMVVEAHGGRIFVQSNPQQGSTFTFLLPALVVEPAAEMPFPSAISESTA